MVWKLIFAHLTIQNMFFSYLSAINDTNIFVLISSLRAMIPLIPPNRFKSTNIKSILFFRVGSIDRASKGSFRGLLKILLFNQNVSPTMRFNKTLTWHIGGIATVGAKEIKVSVGWGIPSSKLWRLLAQSTAMNAPDLSETPNIR